MRVLLVEDSAPDAELTADLLHEGLPGCVVTVVDSLAAALDAVLLQEFDVALVDLSLPDADGLQSVLSLRRSSPLVALLVLTGLSADEVAQQALAAGAQDYLLKAEMTAPLLARAVRYARSRAAAESEVRRSRAWAQDVLDSIEAPTCALNPQGKIVAVNAAWSMFTAANGGDPASCGVGTGYLEVCRRAAADGDGQAAQLTRELERLLERGAGRVEVQYPCHSPTEQRWFTMRATPVTGGNGAVITHLDITELRLAREELRDAAMQDALTGLPNRRQLFGDLRRRLEERGPDQLVAVLFLDLDRFKLVNDTYGHSTGDALLVRAAAELTSAVRAGDLVVRHAGDEFVVVATVASEHEARALADRLQGALCQTVHIDDHELSLSASQGLVVSRPGAHDSAEVILAAADAAMHEAKERGRGRVEVYSDELKSRALARVQLQRELQAALELDEFELYYQPIVEARTGAVHAVEALVRWNHPQQGLLTPAAFLDVAESSGLIVPLGERLLHRACEQGKRWHDAGHTLSISVNLSAKQLNDKRTASVVRRALEGSGLDPAALIVEVTETSMIDDTDSALASLTSLKALGVRVAVDDFGTGYSSLSYLKRYPVDIIKVDRSFVSDMLASADDHAIVASLVALASQLQLAVVAEGVETVEQQRMLEDMGCHLLQGYLFARPEAAATVQARLECGGFVPLPELPSQRARTRRDPVGVVDDRVLTRMREIAQGGASLHTIAAALNAEHLPHPRGLRWHARSVARYLAEFSGVASTAAVG
jgi:diguanylate cyclase (GGDEF)-like protein